MGMQCSSCNCQNKPTEANELIVSNVNAIQTGEDAKKILPKQQKQAKRTSNTVNQTYPSKESKEQLITSKNSKTKKDKDKQEKCAVIIQKHWRGHKVRTKNKMKKSQEVKQNNTKLYFDDAGDAKSLFFLQYKIIKPVHKKWQKKKDLPTLSKVEPPMKVSGKDLNETATVFKSGRMVRVTKESGL